MPVDSITRYNSWIKPEDCDGSLYDGLSKSGGRAVCTSTDPPICTFDEGKWEHVCSEDTPTDGTDLGDVMEGSELE